MKKYEIHSQFFLKLNDKSGKQISQKIVDFLKKILNTNSIYCTEGPKDNGIDAVYLPKNYDLAMIFQFKSYNSDQKKFKPYESEGSLNKHYGAINRFILSSSEKHITNLDENEKSKIDELADLIFSKKIKRISVYYFTFRPIKPESHKEIERTEYVKNIFVEYKYFDNYTFEKMFDDIWQNQNYNLNVKGREGCLKFNNKEIIKHNSINSVSSITVVSGLSHLAEFIEQFVDKKAQNIDELTNENVRDFLNIPKNKKNNSMESTFVSENEYKNNYLYHMGIVITCTDLKILKNNLLKIKSPSFVNGAQTMGIIWKNWNNPNVKKDTNFLVKIIKTNDFELTKKIILFSNSQTNIKEEMKYGFDNRQKEIFNLLANYGYFYDYRGMRKKKKKEWKQRIKNKARAYDFKNLFSVVLKADKTKITPSKLGQALYVIEKPDEYGKIYNSLKLLRYSSSNNYHDSYNKTFFKQIGEKIVIKGAIEYLVPFAIVETIEANKEIFQKNTITDLKEKKILLTENDIKKLRFFLSGLFVKMILEKNRENKNIYEIVMNLLEKQTFKIEIKEFIKSFKKALENNSNPELTKLFNDSSSLVAVAKGSGNNFKKIF